MNRVEPLRDRRTIRTSIGIGIPTSRDQVAQGNWESLWERGPQSLLGRLNDDLDAHGQVLVLVIWLSVHAVDASDADLPENDAQAVDVCGCVEDGAVVQLGSAVGVGSFQLAQS